jgi:hypothetical protein
MFYLIHNEIYFITVFEKNKLFTIIIYLLIGLIMGWFSLEFALEKSESITKDTFKIKKIYPVYTELMPVFLAIVVIAFELNEYVDLDKSFTVLVLFVGILVLYSMSNIGYINPVWYFFGYRVYKVDNDGAIYVFIAHKNENYKSITSIKVNNVKKIDEFIFIKRKE